MARMAGLHVSQLFRWRKELEPPNRLRRDIMEFNEYRTGPASRRHTFRIRMHRANI
ncbi:hypothetical protein CO675_27930 [Bradyrhizobium sp. C9]|nr:hypothetical protein CO675_27930 [Bradyrhizobium sp. C9]